MTKTVRWGILGAAHFAKQHMAPAMQLARNTELVALGTSDGAKAAPFKALAPGLKVHSSYDAVLNDPDIDAVYIPLPNHLHVAWVKKAIAAGKHVLCEKPIAMQASEIDELIALRDSAGLMLVEAYMIVHHPQWQYAKALFESGVIGDLVQVDGEGRIIAHQLDVSPENDLKDAPDISNISQWTVSSRGLLEPVGKPWFLPFSSYEMEWSHDDLLLRMGQDVWHFGLAEQGGLNLLGAYTPSGCYGFSLDGSLLGEEGLLWAPGGDYGALALTQHDAEQPVVRFATGVRFDDCESYCEESLYIERTYTTFVA
ncbi:MAG: Gfo/Idh/MocA family protein, partial [Paracoccaceae bacterium]